MASVAPRTNTISFEEDSIEEVSHLGASILVRVGRARGQLMGGPMDVGVLVFVEIRDAIDHALRFLSGRRVVQPDQRMAVHLFVQDRKIAPYRADIKLLPGKVQVAHVRRMRLEISTFGKGCILRLQAALVEKIKSRRLGQRCSRIVLVAQRRQGASLGTPASKEGNNA